MNGLLPCVPQGLDAAYITPRIIAMGAPYDEPPRGRGRRAARNPSARVVAFLTSRHPPPHFRVFDLTIDEAYASLPFYQSPSAAPWAAEDSRRQLDKEPLVWRCGWQDFRAPTVDALAAITRSAQHFLARDRRNVVVFHCKAGRARTCTAVAALRLRTGECATADEAIAHFEKRRGMGGCGGCQKALVRAFERYLRTVVGVPAGAAAPITHWGDPPAPRTPLVLESVTLSAASRKALEKALRWYKPVVELRQLGTLKKLTDCPFSPAAATKDCNGNVVVPVGAVVDGDVEVTVANARRQKVHPQYSYGTHYITSYGRVGAFRLAFHTHFVQPGAPLVVPYNLLDGELLAFHRDSPLRSVPGFAAVLRMSTPSAYFSKQMRK